MAVVEKLAKGGGVVADGGLGQRGFGTLSARARREQRGAEPEQKPETLHDRLLEHHIQIALSCKVDSVEGGTGLREVRRARRALALLSPVLLLLEH
jgi:hypothetical protein